MLIGIYGRELCQQVAQVIRCPPLQSALRPSKIRATIPNYRRVMINPWPPYQKGNTVLTILPQFPHGNITVCGIPCSCASEQYTQNL